MSLPKWLANPYLVLLGIIVSAAALIFGIYSYKAGQEYRELQYAVAPERAVLIDSQKASDFEIYYKGNRVESDVTSAILTLWNQGKKSIRPENVLERIEIKLSNRTPILEAKTMRVSRDITGFTLETSKLEEGIVSPKWQILEHKDGAVIQVVYAGGPEVTIEVSGIIEGRRDISNRSEWDPFGLKFRWHIIGATLVAVVVQSWRYLRVRVRGKISSKWELLALLNVVWVLVAFILILFVYANSIQDRPPAPF